MNKLILGIFTLVVMVSLTGCGDEPKDFLEDSIESYIETLHKSNSSSIKIQQQSKIKQEGKYMISSIILEEVSEIKGQKLVMNLHLKAYSEDNGTSWYFSSK